MGNGNASIEFVSENGPIDFSVMMQEGVKALTKILSTHLQDNPDLINEKSMKVIFKDNNGKLEPVFAPSESISEKGPGDEREIRNENASDENRSEETDEDYEVIEFDNEGNYHVCAKGSEDRILNPDRGRIQEIDDSSEEDSCDGDKSITGDGNLNISNNLPKAKLDVQVPTLQSGPISSTEHEIVFEHENGVNTRFSPSSGFKNEFTDKGDPHPLHHKSSMHHDTNPNSCACHRNNSHGSKDGYQYPQQTPHSVPNFKALLQSTLSNRQLCPFCEYYLVFGTPPAYMMRRAASKSSAGHLHYKHNEQLSDSGYISRESNHNTDELENSELKTQTKKKKRKSKKKGKR